MNGSASTPQPPPPNNKQPHNQLHIKANLASSSTTSLAQLSRSPPPRPPVHAPDYGGDGGDTRGTGASLVRSVTASASYLPAASGPLLRSSSSSRSTTPPQHSITLVTTPTAASSTSSSSSSNAMPSSSSSSALSSLRQRNPNPDPATSTTTLSARQQLTAYKNDLKQARKHIRVFTSPITTLSIFASIVSEWVATTVAYLLSHRAVAWAVVGGGGGLLLLWVLPGGHQAHLKGVWSGLSFSLLWLTLGVLSSVGLGTGLHTFVLYLGPYIAKATLAATECGTLDVPLSGAQAFTCPVSTAHAVSDVTFLGLLWKVAPAALLWGAGTAVGELPPYFVSRAATLSGQKLAELDKLTELDEHSNTPAPSPSNASSSSASSSAALSSAPHPSLQERIKLFIYHALQHHGFWAILLLASIPNPLFDLAGLACGHFLIPFVTFFSATVLGKAVIKAQIQTAVVIAAFRKDSVEALIHTVESRIAPLRGKLGAFFQQQREQFHGGDSVGSAVKAGGGGVNWFGLVWNVFLFCMIGWFVVSIVDSSVQERLVTRDQARIEKFAQEKGIEMKTVKDDQ